MRPSVLAAEWRNLRGFALCRRGLLRCTRPRALRAALTFEDVLRPLPLLVAELGSNRHPHVRSYRDQARGLALGLAVMVVFMIMALQVRSLRLPFIVLFTIPLTLVHHRDSSWSGHRTTDNC